MAYFNIKIPELLGIFVNTLSKYARIGEKVTDTSDFLQELRRPAANLFGLYVLQVCVTLGGTIIKNNKTYFLSVLLYLCVYPSA